MAERELRGSDPVELRARKDGNSVAMRLSRDSADERGADLRAEGWEVEIVEVEIVGVESQGG